MDNFTNHRQEKKDNKKQNNAKKGVYSSKHIRLMVEQQSHAKFNSKKVIQT